MSISLEPGGGKRKQKSFESMTSNCLSTGSDNSLELSTNKGTSCKKCDGAETAHLLLLGTVAICFVMMVLSDRLELGMELGCFTAGVIVRSRKQWFEACLSTIEPVRDVFGCLFFASIGLHVYPSFLLSEAMLLITLTAAVIGFKYVITSVVL